MNKNKITVIGIFVVDISVYSKKLPLPGETILGENYIIGPGGKGSNQAVGAAKAGGKVNFISKVGNDQYGQVAIKMYKELNIDFSNVVISDEYATGVAGIMVNKQTGENAISVIPGAAGKISKEDILKYQKNLKKFDIYESIEHPALKEIKIKEQHL